MQLFISKYKLELLSLLAAILLALPWVLPSVGWVIFVAFVPLISIVFDKTVSFRKTAILILCSCCIWFALATSWLYALRFSTLDFVLLVPFLLLYGAILSLPFLFAKYFFKSSIHLAILLLPLSWWVVEWANSNWDLANTWVNLHYALCDYPYLLGFIHYTGFRWASPFILCINLAVYLFCFKTEIFDSFKDKFKWGIMGITMVFICLNVLFQLKNIPSIHQAKIAVVQPNFDPYQEIDSLVAAQRYQKLVGMSQQAASQKPDLICWHETALRGPQIEVDHIDTDTAIASIKKLSQQLKAPILLGTFLFKIYDYRPSNYTAVATGDGRYYDVTNAAMLVQPNGGIATYYKMKLVPFIERLPFIKYLAGTSRSIFALGEQFPSYEIGKKRTILKTDSMGILPVICNESVYPSHVKQFAMKSTDVIIIISNDGWAGNSQLANLHAAYAKILAIENHKYVVRATNNGVSMIITPKGEIQNKTQFGKDTTMIGTIKY